ncbi:hypothetical protein L6164_000015 [Bauhinia variegata]|uniref:Uncharacterized protein n=1 Tax=Bauhinia variegata TaxID=167791 RepID=A0ACB9Q6P6_BAUVA|nr:hypothetical protein L6164_000015 [Bauhinia variegata]
MILYDLTIRGKTEREMEEVFWSVALVAISIVIVIAKLVCENVWLEPRRIRSVLEKQGIKGPKPSFLFGNISEMSSIQVQSHSDLDESASSLSSDHWLQSLFPFFQTWKKNHGPIYMYSTGIKQHLHISKPELIKELKLVRSLDFGRPSHLAKTLKPLLGGGIMRANGTDWAFQRNLIAPEFFHAKIQNMVGYVEESTMATIRAWEMRMNENQSVELVIDKDFKVLSADVLSRACFGSSYAQGNKIFEIIDTMQTALAKPSFIFGFLDLRFLPTKANREILKSQKEVETLILKVINDREEENRKMGAGTGGNQSGKDLLQAILEGAATAFEHNYNEMKHFIVASCKTIYFAGAESISLAASWTMMLLASHPQWQQRVRSEIQDTFGNVLSPHCFDDMDKFRKLKTLTMVIQESLRLYPPGITIARQALVDTKLGELELPKGINMWVFIPTLHRDPDNWGPDANEFKPERFANGVNEACKYPQLYMPFGLGSRICLGQNFAMFQLKIIFSILLSNFSFSLSPNYRHSPVYNMLLKPKYGMRIIANRVGSAEA